MKNTVVPFLLTVLLLRLFVAPVHFVWNVARALWFSAVFHLGVMWSLVDASWRYLTNPVKLLFHYLMEWRYAKFVEQRYGNLNSEVFWKAVSHRVWEKPDAL